MELDPRANTVTHTGPTFTLSVESLREMDVPQLLSMALNELGLALSPNLTKEVIVGRILSGAFGFRDVQ